MTTATQAEGWATQGFAITLPPDPTVYATTWQKEQLIALLNDPLIYRWEKTKMLLSLGRLSSERATQAIERIKAAIEQRQADQAPGIAA